VNCVCESKNKNCTICEGKGIFTVNRCPVKYASDPNVNIFLPYFYHWKATNYMMYPDGKGRIYQPTALIEALTLCSIVTNKRDEIESNRREQMNKRNNHGR
jgi:hypothetical protein